MAMLKSIRLISRNRTTYRVGLLQAKAYRILKQRTTAILKPFGISTIEWAFLGLLADRGSLRAQAIAQELGVEPPFVTVMTRRLEKREFVSVIRNQKDSRVKLLSLTEDGKKFITAVEPIVRTKMRPLVADITAGRLVGYLETLEGIVRNAGGGE